MEPTKFFSSKGYGKVTNPSESHQESISYSTNNHSRRRRSRIVLAAASFAIFLTVLIAVMVIALVHESSTESPEEDDGHPSKSSPSSSSISSNAAESLKIVCSVTQHPDSCISSISSLNNNNPKADPVHFFNLSLAFSFHEVKNLSSLPKELIPKANDKRIESALQDCLSLFENSVSQLNDSAAQMKVNPGEKVFTEMKISNLQTWISAAMTDEETCLNGLEEIGGVSTVGDEVKMKVHKSEEYMSNTLAILNNLQSLLGKFGLTMPGNNWPFSSL